MDTYKKGGGSGAPLLQVVEPLRFCTHQKLLDSELLASDAFATDDFLSIGGIKSPPLIIITTEFDQENSENFTSILEHEFIHMAQKLADKYPARINLENSDVLFNTFIENVNAEYEANFVQLYKYPGLYEEETGYSLQDWSILRGFTQNLEKVLVLLIFQDCRVELAYDFLDKIKSSLVIELKKYGVNSNFLVYIQYSLSTYIETALEILESQFPAIAFTDKFHLILNEAEFFEPNESFLNYYKKFSYRARK